MTQTLDNNTRTEDEAAVHAVLTASYDAWTRGDAAGMVADYTDDATAIMPGTLRGGRDVIEASMAAAFAGPFKQTTTVNDLVGLRWVGTDGAIVVTESQVVSLPQHDGDVAIDVMGKVYATWVLEKKQGRWLIAAYHNSPVA